jgi:hypothetical protein
MAEVIKETPLERAKREILEEQYRLEVEAFKKKLRNKKSFWQKIFPWRIIIERR